MTTLEMFLQSAEGMSTVSWYDKNTKYFYVQFQCLANEHEEVYAVGKGYDLHNAVNAVYLSFTKKQKSGKIKVYDVKGEEKEIECIVPNPELPNNEVGEV